MRFPRQITALLLACVLPAGCSSGTASRYEDHESPFIRIDPSSIPFPERTPFDGDPAMRAIYQNYYWLGVAAARMGGRYQMFDVGHPWYQVHQKGFADGYQHGMADNRPPTTRKAS